MERIIYAELVRRIQQGTISKEELAEFFELDPSKTRAFQPIFRVNTAVVDVDGVELAALASGHELALCSLNRLQERILESHPDAKLPYSVIAEGDSWFQHPLVTTVIDALQHRGHRIKNLAWPGDTFEDALKYKEYVPHLQARTVKCFLFSAGGNDVLGTIEEVINRYDGVRTDPNNPAHVKYYINSRFTLKLRKIIDNYGELNDDVRALSSNTLLMIYGYAYARPKVHGTYLGKHFEALGFNLSDARVLQLALAIVNEVG